MFGRSPTEADHLSSFFKLGFYGLFVLLSIVDYALVGTLIRLAYGFLHRKLKKPNLIVTFQDKRYFAQIGALIGLVVGVSELLVFALYTGAIDRLLGGSKPSNNLPYDLLFGIVSGLLSGLIGGLLFGLIHGLSAKKLEVRELRPTTVNDAVAQQEL